MRHDVLTARTVEQQISIFCQFAKMCKSDFESAPLKKFLDMPFSDVCAFLRSRYRLEKGEQIIRPKYFYEIGSDCDDALIFCVSLFLAADISPKNIFVVEAKESPESEDYVHIFCALRDPQTKKFIWFDNLPETKFNKLNYSAEQIRITPLVNYL